MLNESTIRTGESSKSHPQAGAHLKGDHFIKLIGSHVTNGGKDGAKLSHRSPLDILTGGKNVHMQGSLCTKLNLCMNGKGRAQSA